MKTRLNLPGRAPLSTLTLLAALTACGAADDADFATENDETPIGGVNAPADDGVDAGSQSGAPGSATAPPEAGPPATCPEVVVPEGLAPDFAGAHAEPLCDLGTDAFVWHFSYTGPAIAAEDLGDGRFRFSADGGEFGAYPPEVNCGDRPAHLVLGGLGTTGLTVGDRVRLELTEGQPPPENGDHFASGRVFRDDDGALLAAWGGELGGFALHDDGPRLAVTEGDVMCADHDPDATCGWTRIDHKGLVLSAGEDTATVFRGPTLVTLGDARFVTLGESIVMSFNYDCDPNLADNGPIDRSGADFRIVRFVD